MRRTTLLFTALVFAAAIALHAQTQQQESLGDLARQAREQQDKNSKKATKVFTNDNLPAPKPGEAVSSSPPPPESKPNASQETGSNSSESKGEGIQTKEYWQAKFKAARQDIAKAKEAEQLSDDELNLLQIQQAREIDPTAKADLTTKVQAKQSEVDILKATTAAAQKNLDDLEKTFKDSGAPEDWSKTD
jgi:PAB1-binding protein PBP1